MLKLIKWNLVDFFHRYYLVLLGIFASFLLVLLPKDGTGIWNSALITISAILGFIVFLSLLILAAVLPFQWLSRESDLLDRSLSFPAWKILASKLVTGAILNLIACLFLLQLLNFFGRFSSGNLYFLSLRNLEGLPLILFFLLLVDTTLMFSYIFAGSFRIFRRFSAFIAALIGLLIFGGFIFLTAWVMTAAGTLVLPAFSTASIITIDGTLQIQSLTAPVIFGLILTILELFVSSHLLGAHFQKN